MSGNAIMIEKLNSSNYHSWSADMRFVLLERNAWKIVEGTETMPTGKDSEELTKQILDFNTRRGVALSLIYLYVEQDYRKIIEDCTDPVESWKKLREHYFPDNRSRHMKLFSELMNCRLNDNERIDLFAARLKRLYNRLIFINKNFDEVYLTYQLLRYLPPDFENAVRNILEYPDEKFTFDIVLKALISEESRIEVREHDTSSTYNVSHVNLRPPRRSNKPLLCYSCGKPGHVQSSCRYKNLNQSRSSSQARDLSPEGRGARSRRRSRNRASQDTTVISRGQPRSKRSPSARKFNFFLSEANLGEADSSDGKWVFDTAASHHFCNNRELFDNFQTLNEKMAVAVQGATFPIEGKGDIDLKFGSNTICLRDTMYSPKLRRNLISGTKFDLGGAKFTGEGGKIIVSARDKCILFKAVLKDGVYYVTPNPPANTQNKEKHVRFHLAATNVDDMGKWHRRFGHINTDALKQTSRHQCVNGLPNLEGSDFKCEECQLNKFRRVSFKKTPGIRSKHPLELIYTDVWGPCSIKGRGGERFFLSVMDDFSRKISLFPMKDKSEAPEIIKRYINRAERSLGVKVKAIRTDNGREYVNRNLSTFLQSLGIKHELTNTYSPEQNGAIERFNQTVTDGTRTLLHESKLNKNFWPEAMLYFAYTWNRVCQRNQTKTPFELYYGSKPSVRHLKAFGTTTFLGIPKQLRHKLDAKAKKGVMVGYAFKTKGYRIWVPEGNKIIESINVDFNEDSFGNMAEESSGAVMGTNQVLWRPGPMTEQVLSQPVQPEEEHTEEGQLEEEQPGEGGFEAEGRPDDVPPGVPGRTSESASEDDEDSDDDDDADAGPEPKRVTWFRKPTPRPDGTKIDIYYYEKGKTTRLRSLKNVQEYCAKHNIEYDSSLFNFSKHDIFRGEVSSAPASTSVTET